MVHYTPVKIYEQKLQMTTQGKLRNIILSFFKSQRKLHLVGFNYKIPNKLNHILFRDSNICHATIKKIKGMKHQKQDSGIFAGR